MNNASTKKLGVRHMSLGLLKFGFGSQKKFKYLKNEKNNFMKVILKLECLFYHNTYILFHLFIYLIICGLIDKKNLPFAETTNSSFKT